MHISSERVHISNPHGSRKNLQAKFIQLLLTVDQERGFVTRRGRNVETLNFLDKTTESFSLKLRGWWNQGKLKPLFFFVLSRNNLRVLFNKCKTFTGAHYALVLNSFKTKLQAQCPRLPHKSFSWRQITSSAPAGVVIMKLMEK